LIRSVKSLCIKKQYKTHIQLFDENAGPIRPGITSIIPAQKDYTPESETDYMFIKTDKQEVKIQLNNILSVETMQNYIRIYTIVEPHLTRVPQKIILDILLHGLFLQAHKSYLIAHHAVDTIVGNQLPSGEINISIGLSMREEVLDSLVKNKDLKK
jgi:DNA-binding LytR/AlgR family response regulator